tara:strand:+ start:900 stop:1208 length:309 start_codon:yes stop_codon:yes gene_type:complete
VIEYYIISFLTGFLAVFITCIALDESQRRRFTPRFHRVKKEGKWIKINTSRDASSQEGVISVGERELELVREILNDDQRSSRAGHVSLDYTSGLQRKRRRGG